MAGCWDWQKSVIHHYIALHAISTPERVARGQGGERLSSTESSSRYALRHQQRPGSQHAGEGALPCGEDTGNRLRESQTQSAILHEKEEPEVTEPLNIISVNCANGCPIAENIHIPKTVTNCKKNESSACRCSRGFIVLVF